MEKQINIALDVQGDDHSIEPIVEGVLRSLDVLETDIQTVFVGNEKDIQKILQAYGYPS
jgi:fatty acid/phospholipid biosynthesis enzyme